MCDVVLVEKLKPRRQLFHHIACFWVVKASLYYLRKKFSALADRFSSQPYHLRVIYSRHHESQIAGFLNDVTARLPAVAIGSYPKMDTTDYSVKLTIECKDEAVVQQAFDLLIEMLPDEAIFATE